MKLHDGKYVVWNYWDPAGPWDYQANGDPKLWIGVHPKGGYYLADVNNIVTAYEYGCVFDKTDIEHLVATNRDFMWNKDLKKPKFGRIDGEPEKPDYQPPGMIWNGLAHYDATLRKIFESTYDPASWGGTSETPKYLADPHPFAKP
jgi:hypothetical protein